MKTGLLTFYHIHHYGAMLQAYATERAVASLGSECEIIDYYVNQDNTLFQRPTGLGSAAHDAHTALHYGPLKARYERFEAFSRENLNISGRRYQSLEELRQEGVYGIGRLFTAEEARDEEHLYGGFSFVIESDGYTSFGDKAVRPLVQNFDVNDYRFGRATHGYLPDLGAQPLGPGAAQGPSARNPLCARQHVLRSRSGGGPAHQPPDHPGGHRQPLPRRFGTGSGQRQPDVRPARGYRPGTSRAPGLTRLVSCHARTVLTGVRIGCGASPYGIATSVA